MPPSPGKIHQLPVKVLYSIDTSSQSYLTVLHDRQDVYVHPSSPSYATSEEQGQGLVGSCTLKAISRGICYASPECIPNTTSLDFSVYNLDPTVRRPSTSSSSRAFPSSPSEHPSSSTSSWVGRGFLSWVLSENGNGSTLIKGRLVREYEFSSIHFAPEGGLEGLMAMANSNGGGTDGEDSDGKGWGLEVGISLRQLNPDGKIEFQNRKEFEEMLSKGKSTSISTSSPIRGGNSTIGGGSTPARSSPLINSTINRTPNVNATPQHPGPSASSTATIRPPPIAQPTPVPAQQQQQSGQSSRPSSSLSHRPSSSSIPPSSLPPLPSSSTSNVPSSRPSSSIGESRPPPPAPPQQQAEAGPSRNREVTPPPVPRSKSPPPSTPSRHKLHALLRADGMMSPELARHLASNPVLRNLLKAVPSNSNALTALRNITGANKSPTSNANANGAKKLTTNDKDKEKEDSPEATTPTPLPTPQRSTRSAQQGQNNQDGCCNCGTMVSACWRVKKMKDGTPRKVCDDCGLYFNEHKKMRPPELWSQPFKPGQSSTSSAQQQQNGGGEKRKHAIELNDGPASGLRSSPRLNRTNSDQQTHTQSQNQSQTQSQNQNQIPESPRKRQKVKSHGNPPPPSPRRSTRNSSKTDNVDFGAEVFGFSPSNSNSNNNSMFGTSPAIPITSNNSQDHQQQHHHHQMQSFGQSMSGHTHGNGNGNLEELDISAFLATFENSLAHTNHHTSTNGTGIGTNTGPTDGQGVEENNFNFDSLFNGDSSMGIELSQEMQDLLNGWESQLNDPNYLAGLDVNIPGLGDIGNEPGR
ncbi:hypothetical protein V865_004429 [Kwoniella europaea PYCC6329]|uniref:GATA-type domain-containing protein n=1 Tax=Kwoniella europaea PYCC6329 TaxID=1423913 RepID=A0AAX4KJU9_9TREE